MAYAIKDGKVTGIDPKINDTKIPPWSIDKLDVFETEIEAIDTAIGIAIDNLTEAYRKKLEIGLKSDTLYHWRDEFFPDTFKDMEDAYIFICRLLTEFPKLPKPKIKSDVMYDFIFYWESNKFIINIDIDNKYKVIDKSNNRIIKSGYVAFADIPKLIKAY